MILEPGRTFVDSSGRILNGGTVRFCEPGTGSITLKTTYPTDADLQATTNANSNPLTLNSAGRMTVAAHGSGAYRVVVRDSAGNTVWDISDVNISNASTISFTPSPGASATDIQTFLRAIYAKTTAETNAGVTITNYYYVPGDVRRYGAADGGANSTSGFAAAALVAASHPNQWPAGTWNISSVTLGDDATVHTAGFATNIVQLAGYDGSPNAQTACVKVQGSNVTLGTFSFTGQIATDSSEFQHACMVYKTGASLTNITLGDILGTDVRGDVLYIGAPAGYSTSHVRYGTITGDNVHRNVVSIVGGRNLEGVAAVALGGVGYAVYDIEPDTNSEAPTDIHIGYVYGGSMQVAGKSTAVARRISFGRVHLDPALQADSSEGYTHYATQIVTGVWLRNVQGLRIDHLDVAGHDNFALKYVVSGGDVRGAGISIGTLRVTDVGAAESTFNAAMDVAGIDDITIDSVITWTPQADGDYLLIGPSATNYTAAHIGRLVGTGRVARYITRGTFRDINITNAVVGDVAYVNCTDCTMIGGNYTIPTLISFSDSCTFIGTEATCSTAYLGSSNTDIEVIRPKGGLIALNNGSKSFDPSSLADGAGETTTVTCTGAALGDYAIASFSLDLQGITMTAWVSSANTVSVRFQNETGAPVDLSSGTLRVKAIKLAV